MAIERYIAENGKSEGFMLAFERAKRDIRAVDEWVNAMFDILVGRGWEREVLHDFGLSHNELLLSLYRDGIDSVEAVEVAVEMSGYEKTV